MSELLTVKEENGKIYCPLKKEWHVSKPEERVRQTWVCKLVNDYGYSLDQMQQEVLVTNTKKSNGEARGDGAARADLVVWKSKEAMLKEKRAFIVVELKAENVKVRVEDYYQGYNYATWAGASFFVTSNEKETKFFNIDSEYLPKKLDEIIQIPTYEESLNDKKVEELLNKTKTFTRDEFTKTLKSCHNIIRNNDKLSPEAAFDEISKILFMKIREERKNQGVKVFTKKEYTDGKKLYEENIRPNLTGEDKNLEYMQFLFRSTKDEFKDDKLFELNEVIKIRENSFEQILEKLENYNLSDTQDDVKGIAFEQFLGTTFRGELGQFFTPRTIVDFMVEILDPKEGEVVCDPTCGSGGFLIKAFEYMREKIENDIKAIKDVLRQQLESKDFEKLSEERQLEILKHIDAMQAKINIELDTKQQGDPNKNIPESRMYKLSHNCIYGTDANPRMARTSKMNMIMHGDGHGGVHHHDGLLNVNGIFEERFDVILTNPPFGARVGKSLKITEADKFTDEKLINIYTKRYGEKYTQALKQVNNHIGTSLLDLYETGEFSGLTEVLFMERCLRLLKKGGRMGMVLPEGVLNTSNLAKVREWFEGRAKLILICSIPQDVFIAAGATVKPSLVFFKRFTDEEEQKYADCVAQAQNEKRAEKQQKIDELNSKKETLEAEILELKSSKEKGAKAKVRENNIRIKAINKELAEIEIAIVEEAKPRIKELFDYEIPIAMVNDAGITTTGAKSENNELPKLVEEFTAYNDKVKLWKTKGQFTMYEYNIGTDGSIVRTFDGKEEVLTW
ncbi:N-6 DNA methylase [Treponema pectinovorum]|uniref:N-6 DNA methylase n=1 Tax=Treponema pectinovorum TaxID=164 RepID=UPI003D93AA1F